MGKSKKRIIAGIVSVSAVAALSLLATPGPVWADETGGDWRSTYDTVMIWVNFRHSGLRHL